jgi:putative thioredoxin
MQTEPDYRALIERRSVALADKVQAAALALWASGDHDKAIQVLAEGAMAEPDRAELPLLMAKLLTQDGRPGDAFLVLDALPAELRERPPVRRLHTHLGFLVAAAQAPPEAELEAVLAEDPGRLDLRFALAARRLLEDDYDTALQELAEIHHRDPRFRSGVGRRGMLAVIEQLGADDPRVGTYRRLLFQH